MQPPRYPEVYPLKTFTVSAVLAEHIALFSRHGIPEQILTDQGTNFISHLLQELYKAIRAKPIRNPHTILRQTGWLNGLTKP